MYRVVMTNSVMELPIKDHDRRCKVFPNYFYFCVGQDSSIGIVTRYRLDGPGMESQLGVRFSAPIQASPGAHPPSDTMGTGSSPGIKWPGHGVDHPPPPSAKVKERVEIYIYSPSGPLWPVIG